MINLPIGWKETKLSEVALINMGQSPAGIYTNIKGIGLPLVGGAGDYQGENIHASRFTAKPIKISKIGDLIISIRATIGKVAFGDQEYCLGRGVAGITPFVEPRLLFYKLLESAPNLDAAGVGSTFRQIDKKTIENWPILLPPIEEQKRIVAKLDYLNFKSKNAYDHLNLIPKLVEKYKLSILDAAFKGTLTKDWRKENNLKPAKYSKLKDFTKEFSYGSSSKSSAVGSVPVLRMGNIQDGKLDWDNLVYTSDPKEIKKYSLLPGDVLFNRTNSPELVGKTAVYNGEREAIYAGYLIRIRCSENLNPTYLSYCINSPAGREYCRKVKSDGVSQSNINAKKIAEFIFPIPSILEQREIVRRIEKYFSWIERVLSETSNASTLVEQLKKSILSKAFRGELIPQNPNDQPAFNLLEKIKIEMETLEIKVKSKANKKNNFTMGVSMNKKLFDVLNEADDWLIAQEAFNLCGVPSNGTTEVIEPIYSEMRDLDIQGLLTVESIRDSNGKKLYDRIKLKK